MKQILIINGSGGVGKDTFVNTLSNLISVYHTSIVNPVKEIAKRIGWDGSKTEQDRKFLSDLKVLIDNYNDSNYEKMAKIMRDFKEGRIDAQILCIDMREKHQIEKAKNEFGAKAVLVTRDSVAPITSNIADAGVFQIEYDYFINNNWTLAELYLETQNFLAILTKNHLKEKPKKQITNTTPKYEKVIYISHPFQGKKENVEKIQNHIFNLKKDFPNYLFLSPVNCFGFEYDKMPYEQGLCECLWLLSKVDEMWVFGDFETSKGCLAEIDFCKVHNIPYRCAEN